MNKDLEDALLAYCLIASFFKTSYELVEMMDSGSEQGHTQQPPAVPETTETETVLPE